MSKSGFTMLSNVLFDECMPEISSSAFKIVCAIARKTIGWNKASDVISLSQLQELTCLSRKTVISAIAEAVAAGWISQEASGNSFSYSLGFRFTLQPKKTLRQTSRQKANGKNEPKSVGEFNRSLGEQFHTQKDSRKTKDNVVVSPEDKNLNEQESLAQEIERSISANLGQDGMSLWLRVSARSVIASWILQGKTSVNVLIYALAFALAKGKNPAIVFNMVKSAPSASIPPWSEAVELDTGLPIWKRFIWSAFGESKKEDSPVIY